MIVKSKKFSSWAEAAKVADQAKEQSAQRAAQAPSFKARPAPTLDPAVHIAYLRRVLAQRRRGPAAAG